MSGAPLPLPQYLATLAEWKGYGGLHVTDGHDRILQLRNLDGRWQNPGGDVDTGETPDATAEREVLEETGLALKAGRLLAVLVAPPTGGWPAKFGLVFDGGILPADAEIRLDPAEHTEYRLADLADWEPGVPEWTWQRLVACEQARADGVTRYVRLGRSEPATPESVPDRGQS